MADNLVNLTDVFDKIDVNKNSLPIAKYKSQIIETVRNNQIVIICGETGSGKLTQMPQYLLKSGINNEKVIGIIQPTRIAAVNMAMRVCEEMHCFLGIEVGYEIHFKKEFSNSTKIKFMTDEILLNQYLLTPELSDYGVIMIDEAHERSINTDVLLGLLKLTAAKRKDLKILITSSTINIAKIFKYFKEAPIITFPGNMYEVEIIYRPIDPSSIHCITQIVQEIHDKSERGGILIFLTGQEDIEECCELLKDISDLKVFPLYETMDFYEQQEIFKPIEDHLRKVVVSTNIAETSITIDGIRFVIDYGYVKQVKYETKYKIETLEKVRISKAQADQRKGRAGRTATGWCYRLYDSKTYLSFDDETIPEIFRKSLSSTFLKMMSNGIDPMKFNFIDSPDVKALQNCSEELVDLEFLDSSRNITDLGRKMQDLPVEPKIGKVLLTSIEFNCTMNVITILSMLTEKDIFIRSKKVRSLSDSNKKQFFDPDGDHFMLQNVFNKWVENNRSSSWCETNYINFKTLEKIDSVQNQLIELAKSKNIHLESMTSLTNKDNIKKVFITCFYKNVAYELSKGIYTNMLTKETLYMNPSSCLMNTGAKFVLYNEVMETTKPFMRHMITLKEDLLRSSLLEMIKIILGKDHSHFNETDNTNDTDNFNYLEFFLFSSLLMNYSNNFKNNTYDSDDSDDCNFSYPGFGLHFDTIFDYGNYIDDSDDLYDSDD